MADEPQTPPQGDPAPSTPPQTPPTDPTPPPGDPKDGDSSSPDKLKAALDSERALRQQHERDAKAKAKELAEAQARLKELDDAQKSDAEKALARAEAAEKALADSQASFRRQAVDHAIASAARDQGFINPDDAPKFLDLATLEFDDDGKPQGIADRVKALATERPYLLAPKDTPKGPPATPRTNGTGTPTADEQRAHDLAFRQYTRSRF